MNSPSLHRHSPHLAEAIERNISTLLEIRRQMERGKGLQNRIADTITSVSGSMPFLYLNLAWFALWISINLGLLGIPPFDPFPFGLLTMMVSLEAIMLSTFVLISQNRLAAIGDQRADLDLQINLLAEYEITKVLRLVDAIADHLKLPEGRDSELEELKVEVTPDSVLQEMEKRRHQMGRSASH